MTLIANYKEEKCTYVVVDDPDSDRIMNVANAAIQSRDPVDPRAI